MICCGISNLISLASAITTNPPTHIRRNNVPVMRGHISPVYLSGPVTALFMSTRGFDQTGMMDGIISECIHARKYLSSILSYLKWLWAPAWLKLMSTPLLSSSRDFILIASLRNTIHAYTFWRMSFKKQILQFLPGPKKCFLVGARLELWNTLNRS